MGSPAEVKSVIFRFNERFSPANKVGEELRKTPALSSGLHRHRHADINK